MRVSFSKTESGAVTLGRESLVAFYSAHRRTGTATVVPEALRSAAQLELNREFHRTAAQMGADLGDAAQFDRAMRHTMQIHPELAFLSRCEASRGDETAAAVLEVVP